MMHLMDEFNYIKTAYQYYISFIISIATYLTVSYQTPQRTILLLSVLFIITRILGKWHYENKDSAFNRQYYLVAKHSPPWQSLFKVLWELSEDKPEARKELSMWLEDHQ